MVFGEDAEIGFEFLIYLLRFTIGLGMVGGREGDVVFQKLGKFSCESRGELGSFVGDDLVVKTESGEYMMEKDVSNVSGGGSFVARAENHPL